MLTVEMNPFDYATHMLADGAVIYESLQVCRGLSPGVWLVAGVCTTNGYSHNTLARIVWAEEPSEEERKRVIDTVCMLLSEMFEVPYASEDGPV